jgi:hypothetical protein
MNSVDTRDRFEEPEHLLAFLDLMMEVFFNPFQGLNHFFGFILSEFFHIFAG